MKFSLRDSFLQTWAQWLVCGVVVGLLVGFVDAALTRALSESLRLPSYFGPMTATQCGLLLGVLGLVLRALVGIVRPLRPLVPHPVSVLLPAALLPLVLGIGKQFYLPGETEPSGLLFDAVVVVGCLFLGFAALKLSRALPRPTAGRATALFAGLAGAAFVWSFAVAGDSSSGVGRRQADAGRSSRQPNLIILVLDTLRNDHVGWMGYERDTTPNLDSIVGDGTVFTHLISQAPNTKSSCATLLTSLYPTSHGAVGSWGLPQSVTTLTEIMSGQGYSTFLASANSYISPVYGFDQGFDRVAALPYYVSTRNQLGHILRRASHQFPLQKSGGGSACWGIRLFREDLFLGLSRRRGGFRRRRVL